MQRYQPTHLNIPFLQRELKDYPDQRGVSNVVLGVRLEANVELQAVLMPHLASLPLALASVGKELHRMSLPPLKWYSFHESPPYWPCYFNGNGAVERKLEKGRHRRTTEGGGPRRPTFDSEGLRVLSLNQASRLRHQPRHFQPRGSAEEQRTFREWLELNELPISAEEAAKPIEERLKTSKFSKEIKPTTEMAKRDLLLASRAGKLLGMPVYVRVADAKDYFSQLRMAPEDLRKLNLVFLRSSVELKSYEESGGSADLVFVSEKVLGFGCHAASNIAQRFSEMLLWMYRRRMTAADAENLCEDCDPRPAFAAWRASRLKVQAKRDRHRAPSPHRLSELRLHAEHMFTDDAYFITVGVQRTLLSVDIWTELVNEMNLIMAIPEKQFLGTWAPWLGLNFYTALGLITIPQPKMLRAVEAIESTLAGTIAFDKYRSVIGLLEHLRTVYLAKRNVMHGLYEPHNEASRWYDGGPSDMVVVSELMIKQLRAWLKRLASAGGVAISDVVAGPWRSGGLTAVVSSDAANDETAAGLGGFCHGFYWYVGLTAHEAMHLHITLLEFMAAAIGIIVFARYVARFSRVVLLSDAIATPYALSRESEKSPLLRFAHYLLRQTEAFQRLAPLIDVAHLGGDKNVFADYVSRQKWAGLQTLARQIRVRLSEVVLPAEARQLLHEVTKFALALDKGPQKMLAAPPRPLQKLGGPWRALVINMTGCAPCEEQDYVYGGRAGNEHARRQGHARWGNYAWPKQVKSSQERARAIEAYQLDLLGRPKKITEARRLLKGKRLGCFCAPENCHLHVLAEVANCSPRHLADLLELHRGSAARRAHSEAQRRVELDGERVHPHPGDLALWLGHLNQALYPQAASSSHERRKRRCVRCGQSWSDAEGPRSEHELCTECLAHQYDTRPAADAGKRDWRAALAGCVLPSRRQPTIAESSDPQRAGALSLAAAPPASRDWREGLRRRIQPLDGPGIPPPANIETATFATGEHTFSMVLPVATARRRDSALRDASREVARRRARRLAADTSEGAIGAPLPFLEEIFMAADDLAEYGVNYNTNTKDAHAFDQWIIFCEMMDTEPLRTARMARDDPEREQHLLSLFALWVYPRMKPRSRDARWAKPASALAYPLAIIRIFGRWGVHLPKITGVRAHMAGLMRVAVVVFGSGFLVPQRKEPLTLDMIEQIRYIPPGAAVGSQPWDVRGFKETMLLDILSFLIVTGFRLAELVYHASGEIMFLVHGNVTAVIGGRTLADPTEAQWRSMRAGDYLVITPPRSKTDQFGEIHCPYPCILPFEDTPLNAARRLREAALRRPCHGEARAATPLFATARGEPFSHSYLDTLLRAVLIFTIGPVRATLYSFHSARIGLACALRASGCPPETVQLICRWMCPESLRVYALKGVSEHASWVSRAMTANVDAVRGTSYPVISAGEGLHELQQDLAQPWSQHAEAAVADAPLATAPALRPARPRVARGRRPLPKQNPALGALLAQHGVTLPPGRVRVAERQRLLLVACPQLADSYEVPADVLASAGVALGPEPEAAPTGLGPEPEAPPEYVGDVD